MENSIEERLEKMLRTKCRTLADVLELSVHDTLISGRLKEAAEKVLGHLKSTFLSEDSVVFKTEDSIVFKTLDTQGEKTMPKLDAKRRKDLQEGRDSCKSLLASIERELASDSEDTAEKSAGAIEFHSPNMKSAISEARQRPIAPAFTR